MDRLDKIINELNKVVEEATQAPAKPLTVPTTPTKPSPTPKKNPITPSPNIKPNPKATNKDVELFMSARADKKKVDDVEESKEVLVGGKGDETVDSEFDADQMEKGEKVEREHTDNPAIAKEIVKDHLSEFDKYYDALDKMESGLKKNESVNESWKLAAKGREYDYYSSTDKEGKTFFNCVKSGEQFDSSVEGGYYNLDSLAKMKNDRFVKPVNEMAFETGGREDLVHPDKKDWIESGDEVFNEILPTLSDEEQTYLEKISSKSYQDCVDRIKKYSGITKTLKVPSLMGITFEAIRKIVAIENKYTHYLEDIALENILAMEEYKLVKDNYDKGLIKFDLKMKSGELKNKVSEEDLEAKEGLSKVEQANVDLFDEFEDDDEATLQRRVANLLIQGKATSGLYLFNMMKEDIERIDPALMNLYGIAATGAQIGYFIAPFGMEVEAGENDNTSAGSSEVMSSDEGYTVKCRGMVFPYLVHEIIKGIMEYLSLTEDHQEAMKKDTIENETKDIMVGTEVSKAFQAYVPKDKQYLMPIMHKLFIKLDTASIKEVLKKSPAGKSIMQDLIDEAELAYEEYKQEPQAEEPEEEWSEENEQDPDPEFREDEWEKDFEDDKQD